jgi:hypothetical protein
MPVKTPAEIQYVAVRNGWKVPKTISKMDIARASSDMVRFWEVVAPEVLAEAQNEDANRAKAEAAELQEKWSGKATPADDDAARAAGNSFAEAHPQFIRSLENSTKISDFMRTNGIDPRQTASYQKAFDSLAVAGKLVLSVDGHELTGRPLQDYIRQNPSILDAPKGANAAEKERKRIANLSADNYEREFQSKREMMGAQISERQRQAEQRAFDTFFQMHPSFPQTSENLERLTLQAVKLCQETGVSLTYNTVEAAYKQLGASAFDKYAEREFKAPGMTRYTNLGGSKPGAPQYTDIEKTSLQQKIRKMSSKELDVFLRENPSARAAIDG